jgi:para-aminobenzoate synthetase component 1
LRPLIREIPFPKSPFAAFRALCHYRHPFLLDSALVDERLGRWSFMGANPFAAIRTKGQTRRVWGTQPDIRQNSPFAAVSGTLARYPVEREPDDPPFLGGAVGYWGYELRHFVERLPCSVVDDVPVPDCCFGFYDAVIALDHWQRRAWVVATPVVSEQVARKRLAALAAIAATDEVDECAEVPPVPGVRPSMARHGLPNHPGVHSTFARDEYISAVLCAKEYIAAGDTFQINLSQRLSAPVRETPLELYARLRAVNPAPFAAYLDCADFAVLSASPERFLRIRGGSVETRPIKGTRPRGGTTEEDERLARELLTSDKDRAENVMIVDLERNDLGRTCAYGSVHVTELCALERYETVFHLVSTVVGTLHESYDSIDCLKASFPGGSITGAPKVRSMEIIDELEPTCRGVYTGAIGYHCFSGDIDTNIVIRTIVVKDGWAHFQVGGGIVADSDPAAEYEETLDKARALIQAVVRPAGVPHAA